MYNDINADKSDKELFIIIINVVILVISMKITTVQMWREKKYYLLIMTIECCEQCQE